MDEAQELINELQGSPDGSFAGAADDMLWQTKAEC